jgi:alkylated DNA repair dioxygenase AlkB
MCATQDDLFGTVPPPAKPAVPQGLRYAEDFLTAATETALVAAIRELPLANAAYKQYTARRRVVSFGGSYDFTHQKLDPAAPIPAWLHDVRARAAQWAQLDDAALVHCLVAEYAPGTPLGWHRDVPDFEAIVGISLTGPCVMRFRRYPPQRPEGKPARADFSMSIAPRSIYTLQGSARWEWQHAVSPTKALRYSLTFRTRSMTAGARS